MQNLDLGPLLYEQIVIHPVEIFQSAKKKKKDGATNPQAF